MLDHGMTLMEPYVIFDAHCTLSFVIVVFTTNMIHPLSILFAVLLPRGMASLVEAVEAGVPFVSFPTLLPEPSTIHTVGVQ